MEPRSVFRRHRRDRLAINVVMIISVIFAIVIVIVNVVIVIADVVIAIIAVFVVRGCLGGHLWGSS